MLPAVEAQNLHPWTTREVPFSRYEKLGNKKAETIFKISQAFGKHLYNISAFCLGPITEKVLRHAILLVIIMQFRFLTNFRNCVKCHYYILYNV